MPIPRITVNENGVVYERAVFAAPFDKQAPPQGSPWWHNGRPLCVAEYRVANTQSAPADA